MATTWIKPLHKAKGRSVAATLADRIGYADNPDKTNSYEYVKAMDAIIIPPRMTLHYRKKYTNSRPGAAAVTETYSPIMCGSPSSRERLLRRRRWRSGTR